MMGKKKKGRLRGRGGPGGYNAQRGGGGNGYRPRPMRPQTDDAGPARNPRTTANRGRSSRAAGSWKCTPTATASFATQRTTTSARLTDPFVPGSMIEKFGLREGVMLSGMVQAGRRQQGPRLKEVLDVDGMPPGKVQGSQGLRRPHADQSRVLAPPGNRFRAA